MYKKRDNLLIFIIFSVIFSLIFISLTAATKYTVGDIGYDYAEITSCLQQINDTFDSCYVNTANLTYTINYTAIFNFGLDISGATVGTAIILNNTNITLDCNYSTILGNRTDHAAHTYNGLTTNYNNTDLWNCKFKYLYYGAYMRATNSTIINSTFFENQYGLSLDYSNNITVVQNTFYNNTDYDLWFTTCLYGNVSNNTFSFSRYSIYMDANSSNGFIRNNNFLNVRNGINIINSKNQKVSYNNMTSSRVDWKIRIEGTTLNHFIHDIDNSNYINDMPVYYNNSISNYEYSNLNAGFLMCNNCTNIAINNLTLTPLGGIIELSYTNYSRVQNNTLNDNWYGVYTYDVYFSNFTNNIFSNNSIGIYLIKGGNNTIENNTVSYSRYGAYLSSSNGNLLINNDFNYNEQAIYLSSAKSSNITNNTIKYSIYSLYDNNYGANNNFFTNNSILHASKGQLINFTLISPWASQNENVSFLLRMSYYNTSNCQICRFNISIKPETTFVYNVEGENVTGSFFPTQVGFYSILVNVTDNFNNTELKNYGLVVNGSESIINYYFYQKTAGHNQHPGLIRDIGSFRKTPSSETETTYCSAWTGGFIEELPNSTLGVIKEVNLSLRYVSEVSISAEVSVLERYGYYSASGRGDPEVDIGDTKITRSTQSNFTNLNWTMDYTRDWYRLYFGIYGYWPEWTSEPNNLTYANINYISAETPSVSSLSNYIDARILSATSSPTNLNNASIIIEGEGSTDIVFQMHNPGTYTLKYDGVECTATSSTCKINSQTNGLINLTVTLGSEHTITIQDTSAPVIILSPSSATSITYSTSYTVGCSATDNVAVSSVSLTFDGVSCSGTSSCSATYIASTTGTKVLSCIASDASGNSATSSVNIIVNLGGGGVSSGGGGDSGTPTTPTTPTEPVTPLTGEVTPPSSIATQIIEQASEETGIIIPDPSEGYSPINIPQSEITSTIANDNIIISLGDMASIIYSYIKKDGKPRVDIKFNQVDLKYIGELVSIKYFDILELIIKILTGIIFLLIITSNYFILKSRN